MLTEDDVQLFRCTLCKAGITIQEWCDAAGISYNRFLQDLNGCRKRWVVKNERLVREVIEEAKKP